MCKNHLTTGSLFIQFVHLVSHNVHNRYLDILPHNIQELVGLPLHYSLQHGCMQINTEEKLFWAKTDTIATELERNTIVLFGSLKSGIKARQTPCQKGNHSCSQERWC